MSNESTINLDKLAQLLVKNTSFHFIVEKEVKETPYGQITFNFEVKDGVVVLSTLNIVKNCRRRYNGDKGNID